MNGWKSGSACATITGQTIGMPVLMASLSSAWTSAGASGCGTTTERRTSHLASAAGGTGFGWQALATESEDEDGQQQETAHGCSYRQVPRGCSGGGAARWYVDTVLLAVIMRRWSDGRQVTLRRARS